jgi:hypothetical protein
MPFGSKTKSLHHFQEVSPRDRIEGFDDVQFYEDCWDFLSMQLFGYVLDYHKVVVNATLFDKGTLAR